MIAGSREKMRHFSISYEYIIISVAIVAFLFVADIVLVAYFLKSHSSAIELKTLKVENELLSSKYEELRVQVAEITDIYSKLVEKEKTIRNIFNLPEISQDERELGIGGPEFPVSEALTEGVQQIFATEAEVDALVRLSRFETDKYEEVYGALAAKKAVLDHTPSITPTRGRQTRGYGMKADPFTGYKQFHSGIDIANRTGTPIYATADGVVTSACYLSSGLGSQVTINHGYNYVTQYGHMSKINVRRGQTIRRGDVIGLIGSTGYSTGPHLHYEVHRNGRSVNPLEYILNI